MKRKILSILFAVVLVAGLGLVTAVPAAAQEEILQVVPFTLGGTGSNEATWSTEQAATGSYSVKLDYASGDNCYAEFVPATGITMSDLDSIVEEWSYWYYSVTQTTGGPNMELLFTEPGYNPGDGWGRAEVNVQVEVNFTADVWAEEDAVTNATVYTYFYDPTDGTEANIGLSPGPFYTLGTTLAAIDADAVMTAAGDSAADWELTRVRMEVGWGGPARVCYIDDVTIDGVTYYGLIQDAIDAASNGDTIIVADGDYPEDIATNGLTDLTIKSVNGSGSTTITGQTGVTIEVKEGSNNFTLGGPGAGFTVNGSTGASTTFLFQITNGESGVTIEGNTFDTTGDASQGISVGAAGATDLTISNNTFIAESGDGSIWGPNVVDVTVSTNTLSGGSYAIQFSGVTGTSTISNNTISGYTGSGAIVISNGAGTSGLTISGNTISSCSNGVYLVEYCAQGTPDNMTTVTVTKNKISGSTNDAVKVGDGTHVIASNFDIHYNSFSGSTGYGLNNQHTSEGVDARFNWWGDASGPEQATTNTTATGDEVTNNVDYSPWWGASYLTGTAPNIAFAPHPWDWHVNETGGSSLDAIQEGIDVALEGDTVTVHDGTYNENIVIDKSLTIQSVNGWQKTTISPASGDVVTVAGFAGTLLFTGFEITGGGEGIDVVDLDGTADVTISHCFIWNNSDGIHCGWVDPESTLTIEENIITENTGDGINFGVGNQIVEGTVTIQDNVIGAWYGLGPAETWISTSGNGGDGIHVWQLGMLGTMTIDENIIAQNGSFGSDGIHVEKVGAHPDAENPNRGLHITNNAIGAFQFWYDETHHATVGGNLGDGIEIVQSLQATFINIQGNAISENESDGIEFGMGPPVQGTVTILENLIGAWTWYPADADPPMLGDPATFGGNLDHGIYISNGISQSGNVLIENNNIAENSPMTSGGIHVDGTVYGVLDIINNRIGAWTDAHDESYDGNTGSGVYINQVSRQSPGGGLVGGIVTIAGNTISENTEDGIDIDRIYDNDTTVTIDDNIITYNEDGIDIHRASQYAVVGITQNFIAYQEHGIRMGSDADGIDIVCNIITENEHGIWVKGDGNNITRNEISFNVGPSTGMTGIHLESGADNNQIHYNNITGNSAQLGEGAYSYGVYKEGSDTQPVDATNNWWGDVTGPGGSGPGIGDWVNDLVTYDPFLTAPATSCFEGETGLPVIDKAGASPSMVSIWYDDMLDDMWSNPTYGYSVGPTSNTEIGGGDTATFYVVAHDDDSGVASVTMNWKDLLIDYTEEPGPQVVDGLIPEDKLQKFIDQLELLPPQQRDPALDEWQLFLAQLEALPLKYNAEYDCWWYPCRQLDIYDLLVDTLDFFDDWLHWDSDEEKVIMGEIIGQELNLCQFYVEVTVTDFKGNFTTGYIPITIVDYQMPVCEGWNLRSTWLALEENKWENIVPTMHDPLNVDSILRWNSELQRWEYYMEVAGVGYWYYGIYQIAPALMQPLESYWIHSLYNDQFGLITQRGITAPPSRQMYAGWNLIGTALAWQQPGLKVDDALLSVYEGEAHCTGYTQVLSIDQYNKWWEDLWVCDSWLYRSEYYEKWFKQETWVYTRDFGPQQERPRMTRGGGYWVFMANPTVLAGFNSTPLPIDFWEHWWSD